MIDDVALLVYFLHLAATQAETRALILFHVVLEKVVACPVGARRRITVFRPH